MRSWGIVLNAVVLLAAWDSPATGGQGAPPLPLLHGASSTATLASNLRGYLIEHLPQVLVEDNRHWGQQKLVTRGLEWKGQGQVLPQAQKRYKNHGVWRRIKVTTNNVRDSLVFDLRDVQRGGPDRLTFTAFIAFDARAEYEQQNWRSGIRTYSGSLRARLRVETTLSCEMTSRLDRTGKLVPDLVFRGRVLRADVRYANLVVEHINGVGGDLAQVIGKTGLALLHQWRPSLKRKLLEKGNAAIVKAGDTKDVRISLTKLLEK